MELEYKKLSIYEQENEDFKSDMFSHCDKYIKFLNYAKTEYRCIKYFIAYLEKRIKPNKSKNDIIYLLLALGRGDC